MKRGASRMQVYSMFRYGRDTLDIARLTGRSEAEILRDINVVRSALKDLPYPYPPFLRPAALALPKTAYLEGRA